MKKRSEDAIEFPANPFVALADFLMLLVLILILSILHQSVSSSRLMERMAVSELQQKLLTQVSTSDSAASPLLQQAYKNGQIKQTWIDGDLQRFWFDSRLFFKSNTSVTIDTEQGKNILASFGRVLKRYEGNLDDPGSGLYKRIIIEGHADRSDGDDNQAWTISLEKARAAVSILQATASLSPKLLEASGRGCWVAPDDNVGTGTRAERNRRVEVVIVYSGSRALQYLQSTQPTATSR